MYKKHLTDQAATETAISVHRTRLKNAILDNVPGLCATKSVKYVFLLYMVSWEGLFLTLVYPAVLMMAFYWQKQHKK